MYALTGKYRMADLMVDIGRTGPLLAVMATKQQQPPAETLLPLPIHCLYIIGMFLYVWWLFQYSVGSSSRNTSKNVLIVDSFWVGLACDVDVLTPACHVCMLWTSSHMFPPTFVQLATLTAHQEMVRAILHSA